MTAVNQINWFANLGKSGTITDNTDGTLYAGTLLSFTINPRNGVYQLNISGIPIRLVATDDVTVAAVTAQSTTVGLV